MKKVLRMLNEKSFTLIVSLPSNEWDVYEAAVAGGADAVKMHIHVEHRASGNRFGSLEENIEIIRRATENASVPVGMVAGDALEKINKDLVNRLIELNVDFISLYAHHSPPWLLSESRIDKMLAASNEYSFDQSVSVASLQIDMFEASIMPPNDYGTPLSAYDLAAYRRLAQGMEKPIIVPTQKQVHVDDVAPLMATGIKGLMIGAIVTGKDPDSIYRTTNQFKQRIDELIGG